MIQRTYLQNRNGLAEINKHMVTQGEGGGRDKWVWKSQTQTTMYKIDKQQGFTA